MNLNKKPLEMFGRWFFCDNLWESYDISNFEIDNKYDNKNFMGNRETSSI